MNNKGFSLIEGALGMVLVSMTALAFAQVSTNMNLTQNNNDFRLNTNALASSLLGTLGSSASCTQSFQGVGFDATKAISPVVYTLPNKVIGAGIQLPGYNLTVQGLNFINYKLVQTNPDGSLVYFGDLSLTTTATKKVLGPSNYTIVVDSIYLTTSGGVLTGCSNALPVVATPTPSPTPTAVMPVVVPVVNAPVVAPIVAAPVIQPIINGPAVNDPCKH